MLSDKTLERVSVSYARGYRAGYAGQPKAIPDNGISAINNDTIGGTIKPFADYDYEQGYKDWCQRCEARKTCLRN